MNKEDVVCVCVCVCVWRVDLESIMLSEINQRKTDTEWYHLHVETQ